MYKGIILQLSKLYLPNCFRVFLFRLVYKNVYKTCRLCLGLEIDIDPDKLYIGDKTYIGKETCIVGQHGRVIIGSNVMIAHRVNICVSTHPIISGQGGVKRAGQTEWKDVVIGDNCWIGTGAIILPGAVIPNGCVIGAGTVVTNNLEPDGVYVGIPAKRIRDLK